jgi:hypothetical protein
VSTASPPIRDGADDGRAPAEPGRVTLFCRMIYALDAGDYRAASIARRDPWRRHGIFVRPPVRWGVGRAGR